MINLRCIICYLVLVLAPLNTVSAQEQIVPNSATALPITDPDLTSSSPNAEGVATPQQPVSEAAQVKSPLETIESLLQDKAASDSSFTPSYGKWENSLLFKRADAESIKRILSLYESGALASEAAEPSDPGISEIIRDLQIQTGIKEVKPIVYPRFKLRSLIYRSPAEWVVLLNDIRISSYNNDAEKEITVLDVGRNSVSFRWRPSDDELRAELARDAAIRGSGASESSLKNRAAIGTTTSFDKESRSVFFRLSVNQEFDTKTFDIQEGISVNQKSATPAPPEDSESAAPSPAAITPATSQPFPSMQPVINPMAPKMAVTPTAPANSPIPEPANPVAGTAPQEEASPPDSVSPTIPPIPVPADTLVPVPPPLPTN